MPSSGPSGSAVRGTQNSPLPPSVETAYYRKCIELKRRVNEIEESNDAARLRKIRIGRQILKMRLERALLLEQLQKRMDFNVDDSDRSTSPPPTPQEKPLRSKRGHRKTTPPPPGTSVANLETPGSTANASAGASRQGYFDTATASQSTLPQAPDADPTGSHQRSTSHTSNKPPQTQSSPPSQNSTAHINGQPNREDLSTEATVSRSDALDVEEQRSSEARPSEDLTRSNGSAPPPAPENGSRGGGDNPTGSAG